MKEIGKLIELLNEWYLERYGTDPHFIKFEDYGGNDYGYFIGDDKFMVETEVWTKKYGFIKWLVENDKVDFEKPIGEFANKYKLIVPDDFYLKELSKEDELLMLLSIQDEPIRFLCSILR